VSLLCQYSYLLNISGKLGENPISEPTTSVIIDPVFTKCQIVLTFMENHFFFDRTNQRAVFDQVFDQVIPSEGYALVGQHHADHKVVVVRVENVRAVVGAFLDINIVISQPDAPINVLRYL
jgi:hypothetical protein